MPSENKKIGVGTGIMLLKDNKILLGKRHHDPGKADSELHGEGCWTMPGGKMEYGETFEDCVKREVLEETGIILKSAKVICVNNDKNQHAQFITVGLFSDDFEAEAKVMEPDEITEWQWFNLDGLPEPIYFPSANVLKNYRQKLFYIP